MAAVGITENVKGDVRKFEIWYNAREEVYIVQVGPRLLRAGRRGLVRRLLRITVHLPPKLVRAYVPGAMEGCCPGSAHRRKHRQPTVGVLEGGAGNAGLGGTAKPRPCLHV